jgi:hypothetical protein
MFPPVAQRKIAQISLGKNTGRSTGPSNQAITPVGKKEVTMN